MIPRNGTVVESVASAAASIRNQRSEGLVALNKNGAEVSAWIREMVEIYKAQLSEMGPLDARDADSRNDNINTGGPESPLPDDLIHWIDSLKKKELQNELRGRELNTTGLKDELRERLIESMVAERQAAAQKKNNAPPAAPAQEEPIVADAMDISMEKSASVASKPNDTSVDIKMDDVVVIDDAEVDAVAESTPVPMETDASAAESSMPPPKNVSKPDKNNAEFMRKQNESKNNFPNEENHQPSTSKSPLKVKETHEKEVEKPTNNVVNTSVLSQSTSPSRPRSPLRRMQSTVQSASALKNRMQTSVQSALRNLRPVSPKKETEKSTTSPVKPNKQVVVLPEAYSTDETEASQSQSSQSGHGLSAPAMPLVPIPGVARPLKTPASEPAAKGSSKLGVLGVHAGCSIKAKNEARMARLAEMRNKSKPVTSSVKTQEVPTIGGLKSTTSTLKIAATNKRQLLTNQMREKAFGVLGEAASIAPSDTAIPSEQQQQPLSSSKHPPSEAKIDQKSSPLSPTPSAKPARSPVLSPLDTYEMSDHGGSSDTDEEEERARRQGKRVPKWANKENLKTALHRQYTNNSVDPDELFGEVTSCNLEAIFGRKKTKYQKRTSSGNWTRDRATVAEKLAFKRQMGYAVEA